ncbi:MAG: alanine racemase, partial [Desulfobacterium sp.]|nr:alanine racemase [Desulfobacterium sp.]MBU4037163.1 alanine racemase [Pseudomonadota bacterium]
MTDNIIWAEIDLKAIAHNIRELRRITNPDSRLMAVVKANAYGHGSVEVAWCALNNGADFLGVARIEEAILLR